MFIFICVHYHLKKKANIHLSINDKLHNLDWGIKINEDTKTLLEIKSPCVDAQGNLQETEHETLKGNSQSHPEIGKVRHVG